MKVIEKRRSEKEYKNHDYRDSIAIEIDGKLVFSAHDGEPEDNDMARNFSDCYNVINIIMQAHTAGAAGEPLTIERIETD